jgi:uncharacterized protein (DUF58 family)
MLTPTAKMIWWTAWVGLPAGVLLALSPETGLIGLIGLFGLLVVVMFDAVMSSSRLASLRIELPAIARLSKDRSGKIDLFVTNESQKAHQIRIGLPLPREFRSDQEHLNALLPSGVAKSTLTWPCCPLKRGAYPIEKVFFEVHSPLGFWAVRGACASSCEVRVYPNLLTERRHLAALFLNRGSFGIHAQRQVGKGRDFEKLREYIPGDSFDDVHWKATAKRGHPVTKVYQIERTQEIYVVIDASRLSARQVNIPNGPSKSTAALPPTSREPIEEGAPMTSTLERYITAALVLGLAAEQQGDLFGYVTFSDKVLQFVRAKNGRDHYATCRDAIYALQPQIVTPDFEELGTFLRLRLRRRALLVILTALDDPVLAENFVRSLDLMARQHLILVNMMQPPGIAPLFSDGTAGSLDDLYLKLGGHLRWQKLRELGQVLQRRGAKFSLLENEQLSVQLVTQYLNVKQRQLL